MLCLCRGYLFYKITNILILSILFQNGCSKKVQRISDHEDNRVQVYYPTGSNTDNEKKSHKTVVFQDANYQATKDNNFEETETKNNLNFLVAPTAHWRVFRPQVKDEESRWRESSNFPELKSRDCVLG